MEISAYRKVYNNKNLLSNKWKSLVSSSRSLVLYCSIICIILKGNSSCSTHCTHLCPCLLLCLCLLPLLFTPLSPNLSVWTYLKYSQLHWTVKRLSSLPSLFSSPIQIFFLFTIGLGVGGGGGCRPDVGVMLGGVIINIRSCMETKRLKWKGLAGRGDLAMSCTPVIFLVRLELSQGFNWNPDFKETLGPSSSTPSHLHPCTNSPGWIHSRPQHIHTDRDHYNIRESITMHDPGWNWLCSYFHKMFRCGAWICVVLGCAPICTYPFLLCFIKVAYTLYILFVWQWLNPDIIYKIRINRSWHNIYVYIIFLLLCKRKESACVEYEWNMNVTIFQEIYNSKNTYYVLVLKT